MKKNDGQFVALMSETDRTPVEDFTQQVYLRFLKNGETLHNTAFHHIWNDDAKNELRRVKRKSGLCQFVSGVGRVMADVRTREW